MSRLLELAQEAEQSANLGNAIDIKLMMQNYGVLIVKEWSDITKEMLEETLRKYSTKTWNMDRITLKYWMDLIRSKK